MALPNSIQLTYTNHLGQKFTITKENLPVFTHPSDSQTNMIRAVGIELSYLLPKQVESGLSQQSLNFTPYLAPYINGRHLGTV